MDTYLAHFFGKATEKIGSFAPWIYLAVALPTIVMACCLVPPMQVPDEPAHLFRSAQLSLGEIETQISNDGKIVGGHVDVGIAAYADIFCPGSSQELMYCPRDFAKAARDPQSQMVARNITWEGREVLVPFQTTARFAPITYLPQALTLSAGRALGLSVANSFVFARLANGLTAMLLTALALWACHSGRVILLVLALLPTTLFQSASVSQDALLLAFSFLVCAQVTRATSSPSKSTFRCLALLVAMLALSRPPLIALGLLIFMPAWRRYARVSWLEVCTVIAALGALSVGWLIFSNPGLLGGGDGPFHTHAQASYLLANPQAAWQILERSARELGSIWFASTVGLFGWANIALSMKAYDMARLLAVTLAIAWVLERPRLGATDRTIPAVAAALSTLLILLATYLTWCPVGHNRIEGVQGRYFIGLLPLMLMVLPNVGQRRSVALVRGVFVTVCVLASGFILWQGFLAMHNAYLS